MNRLAQISKAWVGQLSTYQPGKPIDEVARELGLGDPQGIVKLASNENALGPSPRAVEAMQKFAQYMHIYPDGDNYHLRRALAKKIGVADNQLFIGHGSNEVIQLLGHVFLDKTANVVISEHAFAVYQLVAALYEAKVIRVPTKSFTHDLTAMAKAITPQTKLVFIANPNNPTGTMVASAEITAFMKDVPGHVAVVFDEAYIELIPESLQPDTPQYVREDRNVFVLRTFSKTYGLAGLRIGYAIAPREGVDLLNRVRQPFNVNAMAQFAALAALMDDDFVQRTREDVAAGLKQLSRAFASMGLEYVPSVANFMLVKVGQGTKVFHELQKRRVIVRPVDGYKLPEYIRVSVGTAAENERLIEALSDVLKSLEASAR